MKDVIDIEAWEQKRKITFLTYMCILFLRGVEKSANTATLWIYLTKFMKTDHPDLYYGLINIAVYILPMLLSSVVARYADKTRRIKLIITILNFVAMLGSISYVVPWSPIFPLIGKLLNGGVMIVRPLIIGETVRSYPVKDIQSKITYLSVSSAIGYTIGPCIVLPFAKLNVYFGNLQITYGNISGVILLFITIIVQLCVTCFAHDLSREYDLKRAESINNPSGIKHQFANSDAMKVLKESLKSKIMLFIYAMTFSSIVVNISYGRNFPVLVLDILSMSYETVSIGLFAHGVAVLLLCIAVIKINIGNVASYRFGIISQVSLITILICQYVFVYVHLHFNVKIALLVYYVAASSFCELGEHLFLVVVFSKLVSSTHQCYLEGVRAMIKQIGSIIAAFFSLVLLKYASILISLGINLILLFLLLLFREDLIFTGIQV